jgi:hypothetical protein
MIHRRGAEAQSFYFDNSACGAVINTKIFSASPRLGGSNSFLWQQ